MVWSCDLVSLCPSPSHCRPESRAESLWLVCRTGYRGLLFLVGSGVLPWRGPALLRLVCGSGGRGRQWSIWIVDVCVYAICFIILRLDVVLGCSGWLFGFLILFLCRGFCSFGTDNVLRRMWVHKGIK